MSYIGIARSVFLPALLGVVLTACGGKAFGTLDGSTTSSQQVTVRIVARAGEQALPGASLTAYTTGVSGQSSPAVGQGTTAADGTVNLTVACTAIAGDTQEVYVVLSAGQSSKNSSASNPIRFVAILGSCGQAPSTVTINELTTVAAAYALNAFIVDDAISGNALGLSNAVATLGSLVNSATGTVASSLPSAAGCMGATAAPNCEATEKLNALANALVACAASADSSSSVCQLLFSCATPGATANEASCTPPPGVTSPTDTWEAITSIARHPGLVSTTGIYLASSASSAYAPAAPAAPNDWTLSIAYTGGGLSEPTALAVDAVGNVWVANYNNAVSKFSPTGEALSPATGYTGGGLEESFGIAIDPAGNVWVCNEQSPASFNSALGSITELASDGSIISGANGIAGGGIDFPEALMSDAAGHIWIANYGNSSLAELASDGSALSPEFGYLGGGTSFPVGIAGDATGNIWVANQGASQISAFAASGAVLSPSAGYTGGGLNVPQSIAVDQFNNVWVSNYYGDSMSEFSISGEPLSPATGYQGGGLAAPGGIGIDGSGQLWIANFDGSSISELAGSRAVQPGAALSSATGFTARSLLQPFAVAIDPSGNLWVSNFGNDTLTKFIGIAAPVATPLMSPGAAK